MTTMPQSDFAPVAPCNRVILPQWYKIYIYFVLLNECRFCKTCHGWKIFAIEFIRFQQVQMQTSLRSPRPALVFFCSRQLNFKNYAIYTCNLEGITIIIQEDLTNHVGSGSLSGLESLLFSLGHRLWQICLSCMCTSSLF
jgi:hypothetical protein